MAPGTAPPLLIAAHLPSGSPHAPKLHDSRTGSPGTGRGNAQARPPDPARGRGALVARAPGVISSPIPQGGAAIAASPAASDL
jgi:hypothetical protein